ncbi:hypothetical protein LINGRAPRIM_LOCUS3348 [Linum grandiflorum]
MASFDSVLKSLAASHVKYTNDHMRSSLHHSIYTTNYLDRRILPSTRLDPAGFTKYGLDPASLIEGPIQNGCFSTFVEGHRILVTPQLLQQVLGIPSGGLPVFNASDFSRVGFDSSVVLLRWADVPYHVRPLADISVLPKYLRVLHFFFSRVLLPRSVGKYLVTGLDVWLLYCSVFAIQTDYNCLMFGTMVHYSDPRQPAISFLPNALGIPLGKKFSAESPLTVLRPSHALREVGFHLANSVNDSGGVPQSPAQEISLSDDKEDNNLPEELERSLQIEEALEAAALEYGFLLVD